jgi:hypothetical protein
MRAFAVTVGLLLALVLAVNGLAASVRLRQDRLLRAAAAAFRPGLAMRFDGHVDERRFQEARLDVLPRPRLVAFGSSRVRDVSGALVGAGPGEFYNLGMSAATVEDYIALWSLLKREGKIPEMAIFSIDVWIFSRTHEQVRWLALAPEVTRFLDAAGAGHGAWWLPAQETASRWFQARELLSYTVLRESIRDLERGLWGRKRRGDDLVAALARDLVPESEVAGRQAIRADGSVMRPTPAREPTVAQLREDAARYVASGAYALEGFRWDAERAAWLDLLWRDMREQGVRLLAYTPPYHPTAWERLRGNPDYAAAVDGSAEFLRGLAGRTGARFLDLSDPAAVPCLEQEFYDAHHPRPACLGRIVDRLMR